MKFRKATREDVYAIVEMLANDPLGKLREDFQDPLPEKYYEAFQKIDEDENQELIVVENEQAQIIGTFQLTFIPSLSHQGRMRAQIEAVRVRDNQRGKGIGGKMFSWAINRSKERGARIVQLTSDKKRPDAIRFYEKLGFIASHEGMKLNFD